MLTIEFEPPFIESKPCECCGAFSTRLTRFVYRDGDAYAVYYARYTSNHSAGCVSVLLSIGEWADDAPPSGRSAFYLRIRAGADQFQVTVLDAADSPWGQVPNFGRALSREVALAHPRINEVFGISDEIVTQDTPIIEYLSSRSQS